MLPSNNLHVGLLFTFTIYLQFGGIGLNDCIVIIIAMFIQLFKDSNPRL